MEAQNNHVDLTYLNELAGSSKEFIAEMISVFTTETPMELEKMEKSLNEKDWKSLRATAHKMKSSFGIMGIKELETVILSIEECASKESNLDLLPELISQTKKVCNEAIIELTNK